MNVWSCCATSLPNNQGIELTGASQHLFRIHEYPEDAPSPLTDHDEDEVVGGTDDRAACVGYTVRLHNFNLGDQKHQKIPVPLDEMEAYHWTEHQRGLAKVAEQPSSLADLRDMVSCLTSICISRSA